MSTTYEWKEGARIRGALDPQVVGAELDRIEERHGLTAESVIAEAAKKRNPLHNAFQWDDTVAAHEYRLEQARHLIRSVVVKRVGGEDTPPVRAFINVRTAPEADDRQYMPAAEVRDDPFLREQVVKGLIGQLGRLRRQLHDFEEFAPVVKAIDEAQERLVIAA